MADGYINPNTYAAKYPEFLAGALDDVEREINSLLKVINRTSSQDQKMAVLLQNRLTILEEIRNAGIDSFNNATRGAYSETFKASEAFYKQFGANVPFLETDLEAFKMIRRGGVIEIAANANIDGVNR